MKKILIALALLGMLLFSLYYLFINAPAYLVVSDKIEKADAIIVLSGDSSGERLKEGVELFRRGFGKYLLLSGGQIYKNLTMAELLKRDALEQGIPPKVILIEDRSLSTWGNARYSLPIVVGQGFHSVIVVTSPYHTRRSKMTFDRLFGKSGIKVYIRPSSSTVFNPDRWWTRHEDVQTVVWEYVSLAMYLFKR